MTSDLGEIVAVPSSKQLSKKCQIKGMKLLTEDEVMMPVTSNQFRNWPLDENDYQSTLQFFTTGESAVLTIVKDIVYTKKFIKFEEGSKTASIYLLGKLFQANGLKMSNLERVPEWVFQELGYDKRPSDFLETPRKYIYSLTCWAHIILLNNPFIAAILKSRDFCDNCEQSILSTLELRGENFGHNDRNDSLRGKGSIAVKSNCPSPITGMHVGYALIVDSSKQDRASFSTWHLSKYEDNLKIDPNGENDDLGKEGVVQNDDLVSIEEAGEDVQNDDVEMDDDALEETQSQIRKQASCHLFEQFWSQSKELISTVDLKLKNAKKAKDTTAKTFEAFTSSMSKLLPTSHSQKIKKFGSKMQSDSLNVVNEVNELAKQEAGKILNDLGPDLCKLESELTATTSFNSVQSKVYQSLSNITDLLDFFQRKVCQILSLAIFNLEGSMVQYFKDCFKTSSVIINANYWTCVDNLLLIVKEYFILLDQSSQLKVLALFRVSRSRSASILDDYLLMAHELCLQTCESANKRVQDENIKLQVSCSLSTEEINIKIVPQNPRAFVVPSRFSENAPSEHFTSSVLESKDVASAKMNWYQMTVTPNMHDVHDWFFEAYKSVVWNLIDSNDNIKESLELLAKHVSSFPTSLELYFKDNVFNMIFEDSTIMSERVITLAVEDANKACSSLRKIYIEKYDECPPLYIIRSLNKVCLNCDSSTKLSKMTYEVAFPTTKTRKRNKRNEDEMHTCQECSTSSSLRADVYVCDLDSCRHKSRQFVCTICWNSGDKEKPEKQILISTDDIAKPDSKNALLYRGSEEINACSSSSSQSEEEIKNSIFGLDSPDSASGN